MKKNKNIMENKFQFKTKLRTGDEVIVISGKESGKKGKIDRISRKKMTVVIPNVNMVKKHKRSKDGQKKPEIVEIAAPLNISNVMLVDPKTGEPTRIGYKFENGKKVRFAKRSGLIIKDKIQARDKDKELKDKDKDKDKQE
jgi:large subunit ribosomal protein L24